MATYKVLGQAAIGLSGSTWTQIYTAPSAGAVISTISLFGVNDYSTISLRAVKSTGTVQTPANEEYLFKDFPITDDSWTSATLGLTLNSGESLCIRSTDSRVKSITNVAATTSAVTLTTSSAHGFAVGDQIVVSELVNGSGNAANDESLNGSPYTLITGTTGSTLVFSRTGTAITSHAVTKGAVYAYSATPVVAAVNVFGMEL